MSLKYRNSTGHYKKTVSLVLLIILVLVVAMPTSAMGPPTPRACCTSGELSEYVTRLLREREEHISVSIPKALPEAGMGGLELLQQILREDSGFVRWGCKGEAVKKTIWEDTVTLEYVIKYRTTKEMDQLARDMAGEIAAGWEVRNLSDRDKVEILREYISNNWRYDNTLKNMTAYDALEKGSATCLGLALASQAILDEMGIRSQTVHGTIKQTNTLHIRLLVKLGDWWYTLDPTALARENPDLSSYLKPTHGTAFAPDKEYLADSFRQAHPTSNA